MIANIGNFRYRPVDSWSSLTEADEELEEEMGWWNGAFAEINPIRAGGLPLR